MLHLSRLNNDLQIRVERDIDKIRGHWQETAAADINIPAMTEKELIGFAIGVYQVGFANHTCMCKNILMKTQNLK